MGDMDPPFRQQNGKPAAARTPVECRFNAVQMRQQFLFDMALLHDIVDVRLFPPAFQLPFIRLIPEPFRDFPAVFHRLPPIEPLRGRLSPLL